MVVFGVVVVVLAIVGGGGVELVVVIFGWYFDPSTQNADFNGTVQSKLKLLGPAPFSLFNCCLRVIL